MRSAGWLGVVALVACSTARRADNGDGGSGACSERDVVCAGNVARVCEDGELRDRETCPGECVDHIGCAACRPGTGTCSGDVSHACAPDGSGYVDTLCDPLQGMSCDASTGSCTGACTPGALGPSYIGCEYFPTITGNTAGTMFDFAVAIANTSAVAASVHIEGGALAAPVTVTVPPRSVKVQALPWVASLKLCNTPATDGCATGNMKRAAFAAKGAYRLRSNQPVTVYQFNALQFEKGGAFSHSNDASLLLPTNVWRGEYYAAAWPRIANNASQLAVTARQDDTVVTIVPRASTEADQGAPAFVAGVPQAVTLNAGDVLEITSRTGDLTGSHVTSTRPVQVISGHYCALVPDHLQACDHLEESMFSVDALGTRYAVNAPAVTTLPSGKIQTVRIIATAPGTTLVYDPPQAGAPAAIANAGDFVEIRDTTASFVVTSNKKVIVAQYMSGRDAGGGTGDPSMALAVPVEQFRKSYLFHAPTNYTTNYVDVTAPLGAAITLDGQPLGALTPIGASGFGVRRVVPLGAGPAGDGNHSISSDLQFGITVYGYGQFTSYWYPGGLDLTAIVL